jgi:hypothetical protein
VGKKDKQPPACDCPVGKFFERLEKGPDNTSSFYKHINRSKLEFLKAVRELVEDRITDLEKKEKSTKKKKIKKIKIE